MSASFGRSPSPPQKNGNPPCVGFCFLCRKSSRIRTGTLRKRHSVAFLVTWPESRHQPAEGIPPSPPQKNGNPPCVGFCFLCRKSSRIRTGTLRKRHSVAFLVTWPESRHQPAKGIPPSPLQIDVLVRYFQELFLCYR